MTDSEVLSYKDAVKEAGAVAVLVSGERWRITKIGRKDGSVVATLSDKRVCEPKHLKEIVVCKDIKSLQAELLKK